MITYTEFIAATIERGFFYDDKYLKIAFLRFDVDNTGFITKKNIKECFNRFGYDITDRDVEEMISDFDIRHDGQIYFEEFMLMMKSEGTDKRIKNIDTKLSEKYSN